MPRWVIVADDVTLHEIRTQGLPHIVVGQMDKIEKLIRELGMGVDARGAAEIAEKLAELFGINF